MRRNEKQIAERIDALPIEQARIEIASGTFGDIGSPNYNFATFWLSAREKNLKDRRGKAFETLNFTFSPAEIWHVIENDYGITKKVFGKKINFIKDPYKRKIIFRDIEQAYMLSISGYNKPAVILSGAIIEELLPEFCTHTAVTAYAREIFEMDQIYRARPQAAVSTGEDSSLK